MRIPVKNRLQLNILTLAVLFLGIGQFYNNYTVNNKFKEITNKIKKNNNKIQLKCNTFSCPVPNTILKSIKNASALPALMTHAIIAVESGGKPNAYNKSEGAIGLMQLRPVVYKKLCGLTKKQAFDPVMNVGCGSLYMKSLLKKFNGNLESALVYYNSGNAMIDTGYANKVKENIINANNNNKE